MWVDFINHKSKLQYNRYHKLHGHLLQQALSSQSGFQLKHGLYRDHII